MGYSSGTGPSTRLSRSVIVATFVSLPLPRIGQVSENGEMKTPQPLDDPRPHLLDLTTDDLRQWLSQRGYPTFRNAQIWAWILQRRAD